MKMSEFLRTNGQLAINPHIAHNPVLSANACLHQLLSQDRGIDDECSGEPISFQQQSRRLRLLPSLTQQAQDVQCTSDNFLLFSVFAWRL
jgi:hypothetical protein